MYRITFNQKTSAYASKNQEANLMFLRLMENTANKLFKTRGYSYINDIYEDFGVEWNPEWENLCRIYNGVPIKFLIVQYSDDGGIIFDID